MDMNIWVTLWGRTAAATHPFGGPRPHGRRATARVQPDDAGGRGLGRRRATRNTGRPRRDRLAQDTGRRPEHGQRGVRRLQLSV